MEKRDPPSLLNRIIGPPLFLLSGFFSALWFFYRVVFFFQNISAPIIVFDKGSYYMLGVGVGLLSLGLVIAIEFWGGKPITDAQNSVFSKLAIFGVVLLFVFPHISHFAADKYLKKNGYMVCREASHQWLFVRDIVYIQPSITCSDKLKNEIAK